MSTNRTLLFVVASLLVSSMAVGAILSQGGKTPVGIDGPTAVYPNTSDNSYRVEISDIARTGKLPGDTYVNISCTNPGFVPETATIRIPAGSSYGWVRISVAPWASGSSTVQAANAGGSVSMVSVVN